jgi:hypothetical protein
MFALFLISQAATGKSKQEVEADRKRAGSTNSDSSLDSDSREKDKKLKKKGSVFGNIFGKKSRKSYKDENLMSEKEPRVMRAMMGTPESGVSGVDDSIRSELTPSVEVESKSESRLRDASIGETKKLRIEKIPVCSFASWHLLFKNGISDIPVDPDEVDSDRAHSPTTNVSSSLATPSLPWSDASIHSFLDNDTSIRDALVIVYEGSRLKKRSSIESINPQISDLYNTCAIHIEEMCSVITPYFKDLC